MIRSVSILLILALLYTEVVCIATWNAFRETAGTPRESIAIAIKATDVCSPVVKSISNSRREAFGLMSFAISKSTSVCLPIAESTTTT
jgi:hypothetical protein